MRVKLKDAFNLQMGKTPSRADLSMWGGNNKWISIADIGSAKKYISSTKECITDEGVSRSGIKVVPEGTVIMSFKLSIGKTAIVSEDMYTNEAIMAFIDNGTYCIDPNYLYHLCCGTDWTQGGNKAVMGLTLNKATLSEMEIELPTIEEQREIASILDQLDAIIEKRHDELNMIEQLVKSRFIELFENTNHPRVALIDLIKEGAGLSYGIVQPGDDGTGDMGVLRPVDMVDGRISTASIKYINRSIGDGFRKTELTGDELLITVRGTTGITALTDSRFRGMNVTRGIAVIRYDRNKIDPVYLNAYLNTQESQRYIQEHTRGATLQQINLSDLRIQEIMLPPMDLQRQLAAFVEQTDKSKLAVQKALEELEILKKSLMQQYFG